MINTLYVKDTHDKVYTKVVAVLLIDGVPTYIDAYGERYEVGVACVLDIEHLDDPYLGIEWCGDSLSFRAYERESPALN